MERDGVRENAAGSYQQTQVRLRAAFERLFLYKYHETNNNSINRFVDCEMAEVEHNRQSHRNHCHRIVEPLETYREGQYGHCA